MIKTATTRIKWPVSRTLFKSPISPILGFMNIALVLNASTDQNTKVKHPNFAYTTLLHPSHPAADSSAALFPRLPRLTISWKRLKLRHFFPQLLGCQVATHEIHGSSNRICLGINGKGGSTATLSFPSYVVIMNDCIIPYDWSIHVFLDIYYTYLLTYIYIYAYTMYIYILCVYAVWI